MSTKATDQSSFLPSVGGAYIDSQDKTPKKSGKMGNKKVTISPVSVSISPSNLILPSVSPRESSQITQKVVKMGKPKAAFVTASLREEVADYQNPVPPSYEKPSYRPKRFTGKLQAVSGLAPSPFQNLVAENHFSRGQLKPLKLEGSFALSHQQSLKGLHSIAVKEESEQHYEDDFCVDSDGLAEDPFSRLAEYKDDFCQAETKGDASILDESASKAQLVAAHQQLIDVPRDTGLDDENYDDWFKPDSRSITPGIKAESPRFSMQELQDMLPPSRFPPVSQTAFREQKEDGMTDLEFEMFFTDN